MRRTLLLVDANTAIQRIVTLTFAAEDVAVVGVSDGEQAIQRIAAEAPDIVLADVGAPVRSGYEIAAYVKGRADRAHIPVLLVASALEPVDQARARSAGCDGVLVKPFEPQQLVRRVRELMAGASGASTQHLAGVPRPIERLGEQGPRAVSQPSKVVQHPSAPLEQPTAPPAAHLPASGPAAPGANDDLGDYYDRLDAVFDNAPRAADMVDLHHQAPDIDLDRESADLPTMSSVLGETSPPPVFKGEILFGASPVDVGPPDIRSAPAADHRLDPFEALLAADAEERPDPPASATPPLVEATPAISDELVEAVATRVIERLAPHGVDELVRRIVADVAERLVREEIDRIRGRK